jgi:hypothetical protein
MHSAAAGYELQHAIGVLRRRRPPRELIRIGDVAPQTAHRGQQEEGINGLG